LKMEEISKVSVVVRQGAKRQASWRAYLPSTSSFRNLANNVWRIFSGQPETSRRGETSEKKARYRRVSNSQKPSTKLQIRNSTKSSPMEMNRIFVGGLPPNATQSLIRSAFQPYGNAIDIMIIRDRSGRSRNFAFVSLESHAQVQKVIGKVVRVGSRIVECRVARPSSQYTREPSSNTNLSSRRYQGKWLNQIEATRMVTPRAFGQVDRLADMLKSNGTKVYQRDCISADRTRIFKRFYALNENEAWEMLRLLPLKERDIYETLEPKMPLCAFQDIDGPKFYLQNEPQILDERWQNEQRSKYLRSIAPMIVNFFKDKIGIKLNLVDVLIADSSGFGLGDQGVYWKASFHAKVGKIRFHDVDHQRAFWRHWQPTSLEQEAEKREDKTGFSQLWQKDDVYTKNRAWRMAYSTKRWISPRTSLDVPRNISFDRPLIPLVLNSTNPLIYNYLSPLNPKRSQWQAHSVFKFDKGCQTMDLFPTPLSNSTQEGEFNASDERLMQLPVEVFQEHLQRTLGDLLGWEKAPRVKKMSFYWQILPDVPCISGKQHKVGGNKMLVRASGMNSMLITCPGRKCKVVKMTIPLPKFLRTVNVSDEHHEEDLTVRKFFLNGTKVEYPYKDASDVNGGDEIR